MQIRSLRLHKQKHYRETRFLDPNRTSPFEISGQVVRYNIFGWKATTDTNLDETLQQLLQHDQEQEKNLGLFDAIC